MCTFNIISSLLWYKTFNNKHVYWTMFCNLLPQLWNVQNTFTLLKVYGINSAIAGCYVSWQLLFFSVFSEIKYFLLMKCQALFSCLNRFPNFCLISIAWSALWPLWPCTGQSWNREVNNYEMFMKNASESKPSWPLLAPTQFQKQHFVTSGN